MKRPYTLRGQVISGTVLYNKNRTEVNSWFIRCIHSSYLTDKCCPSWLQRPYAMCPYSALDFLLGHTWLKSFSLVREVCVRVLCWVWPNLEWKGSSLATCLLPWPYRNATSKDLLDAGMLEKQFHFSVLPICCLRNLFLCFHGLEFRNMVNEVPPYHYDMK